MATIIFHDLTPRREPNPQPDNPQKPQPPLERPNGKKESKVIGAWSLLRKVSIIKKYSRIAFTVISLLFAVVAIQYGTIFILTFPNHSFFFENNYKTKIQLLAAHIAYDHIDFFSRFSFEGNYRVSDKGKQGLISPKGNVIIPIEYDSLGMIGGGLITAQLNQSWGFLSFEGNVTIPFTYEDTYGFDASGYAPVKQGNKWGCINKMNQIVISLQYDDLRVCNSELFGVRQNGKWGFVNDKEVLILPHQYDEYWNPWGVFIETRIGDKYGLVSPQGREIFPPKYDALNISVPDGLITMKLNGKWGIIDIEERVVLPPTYDDAHFFFGNLAAVSINGRWGFVNGEGKEVIPIKYDEVEDFDILGQKARVRLGKEWFTIDKQGRRVEE